MFNRIALLVVAALAVAGCSDSGEEIDQSQRFPDVLEATITPEEGGTFTFEVTLSSPYDTEDRYADGWRVFGPDGAIYAIRTLSHPHTNEQPFTRSLTGVQIPEGIDTVTVEGRDLVHQWGGASIELAVP